MRLFFLTFLGCSLASTLRLSLLALPHPQRPRPLPPSSPSPWGFSLVMLPRLRLPSKPGPHQATHSMCSPGWTLLPSELQAVPVPCPKTLRDLSCGFQLDDFGTKLIIFPSSLWCSPSLKDTTPTQVLSPETQEPSPPLFPPTPTP